MKQENDAHTGSPLRLLGVMLLVAAAVFLAYDFFRQHDGGTLRWSPLFWVALDRAFSLATAFAVIAGAMGLGLRLLALLRPGVGDAAERLVFAVGLGLGVFSLLTLLLGLAGFFPAWLMWAIVIGSAMSGGALLAGLFRDLRKTIGDAARRPGLALLLWLIILLFLVMNLAGAFVPPHMYDVLEYHLAAPAAFHRADRIEFLAGNVYSNFPENAEMLYLLGMRLSGMRDGGAEVGKILNVLLGLWTALAIRACGRRLFSGRAGDAGALFFYVWPYVAALAGVAYVEMPLAFYTILALLAASIWWQAESEGRTAWRPLLVAGLFAGLAAGVKYTALLFVVMPVALGFFVVLALRKQARKGVAAAVLVGLAAVLVLSPWLIKSAVYTGNPTYPLLYRVFGGKHWSPEQEACWAPAHAAPAGEDQPGLPARVRDLLTRGRNSDLLLVLFIPFIFLLPRRKLRPAVVLLSFLVVNLVLWYFLTHRADRFLTHVVPVLALLSGVGAMRAAERRPRTVWAIVLVLVFFSPARFTNYAEFAHSLGPALRLVSPPEFLRDPRMAGSFASVYPMMEFLNDAANVPEQSKVLFLGEARPYYCDRDVVMATVFDRHPLEEAFAGGRTPENVRQYLQQRGITHVLVNAGELIRLQESYRFNYDGKERLGMLDGFDWPRFAAFAAGHMRLVKSVAPHDLSRFDWSQWDVFRERSAARQRRTGGGYPGFIALYELVP